MRGAAGKQDYYYWGMFMSSYVRGVTGLPTITKTPESLLDYTFDWTKWLAGIGLTGSDILAYSVDSPGLTKTSDSRSGASVTAFLTGGEVGDSYTVTCSISVPGRNENRSIAIQIVQAK